MTKSQTSQASSRTEKLKTAGEFSRAIIKDIVKEAVHEEMEERERGSSSRSKSTGMNAKKMILFLGIGILIGAVLSKRMPSKPRDLSNKIKSTATTQREEPTRMDSDYERVETDVSEASEGSEPAEEPVDAEVDD